jgi:hypothetical protein
LRLPLRHVVLPPVGSIDTDTLLLLRALGCVEPEDYVAWATERLTESLDTPSLRILAGLNVRLDADEVEKYFVRATEELEVTREPPDVSPLATARLVRRAHEQKRLSAATVVEVMSNVHASTGEPWLAPWFRMRAELEGTAPRELGTAYPPAALDPLEDAVRREFELLERAASVGPPERFLLFSHCADCEHYGERVLRRAPFLTRIKSVLTGAARYRAVCSACGSERAESLLDPNVRAAYFTALERARSAP